MRSYPSNSPQAAARIVALTVFADGDIGDAEIEWLDRLAVHEQLGLARHELHALLDTFCEDLLSSDQLKWADACPVDERTLADLMGEIQDPALRLKLLRLCVELAEATRMSPKASRSCSLLPWSTGACTTRRFDSRPRSQRRDLPDPFPTAHRWAGGPTCAVPRPIEVSSSPGRLGTGCRL
ncbi:MAG: hypothetical protein WCA12_01135 [Burkholderiales bacterium]